MVHDDAAVLAEDPPEGFVKIDLFINKFVVRIWVGPQHHISHLMSYVSKLLASEEGFDGTCDLRGITSTWALDEGGLVFCEEDPIFELDGWDEADKATIQFIADTEQVSIDQWTGNVPACADSYDGFTLLPVSDYGWA